MIFNHGLGTDARCKTQDTSHEEKLDADFADCAEKLDTDLHCFFRHGLTRIWFGRKKAQKKLDADFATNYTNLLSHKTVRQAHHPERSRGKAQKRQRMISHEEARINPKYVATTDFTGFCAD